MTGADTAQDHGIGHVMVPLVGKDDLGVVAFGWPFAGMLGVRRSTEQFDYEIVKQIFLGVSSDSRLLARLERGLGRGPSGPFIFGACYLFTKRLPEVSMVGGHTAISARMKSTLSPRLVRL